MAPAVDYYLTTNFGKRLRPVRGGKVNMCPWRSWIARVTPTHKVAGSNPVGHTKKATSFKTELVAFSCEHFFESLYNLQQSIVCVLDTIVASV